MQPIGEFYQHDAHVVDHRQEHLANVFRLLLFTRDIAYVSDLRQTFDQVGNFITEIIANGVGVGERVFNHVVQQTRRNRDSVEPHVSENVRYLEGMHQIRFARRAFLSAMLACRKQICPPQQI